MEKKYYEVVSVQDDYPKDAEMYTCQCIYERDNSYTFLQLAVYIPTQKCWSCEGRTTTVTHWLRPVSGILLSVERYEALMKCVEALEQIRTIEASNNERWSYEAMNICEQSLQTLKQTNNE